MSTLLEQWRAMAYDQKADRGKLQKFWAVYFNTEKEIYAQLLKNPDEVVKGTVKELAEKYHVDLMTMVGFLDGIPRLIWDSTRNCCIKTWWMPRQTGFMSCRSGMISSIRRNKRRYTVSRKNPEPS